MRIENKQNISSIEINTKSHNYCPIGKDWYTANISINIEPGELIPDYIDVDKHIAENIEGQHLIIEDVAAGIFSYIKETYMPKYIRVTILVNDAKHSEAKIIKEEGDRNVY